MFISRSHLSLLPVGAACLLVASALGPGMAIAAHADGPETATQPAQQRVRVSWVKKGGYWYCKTNGKKLRGLKTVKGKTYYFDKKGRQRTGWQKIGGSYRFFAVADRGAGRLVKSKTVNGIRIDGDGIARYGSDGGAELRIMVRANGVYQKVTKPAQSQKTRLKKCFSWQLHECGEMLYRRFRAKKGWHRAYARDIFYKKKGSCSSHAAAFAYLANAAGCKKVLIVGSGGHSWSEVNGKVYDPEWARSRGWRYFAFPPSSSGHGGAPAYRSNRAHIVKIAPRKKAWDKKSAYEHGKRRSSKNGLVLSKGTRRFYANGKMVRRAWKTWKGQVYYFDGKGRAVTGSHEITHKGKKAWWVFDSRTRLCTGKKARIVKVAGTSYRVTKSGRAASGWNSTRTQYFLASGEGTTGGTRCRRQALEF